LPALKLSDEEKLATLKRLDKFREWRLLDEWRYYLSCGALIAGRQIQVVGGSPQTGPLRAMCPILSRNLDELGAANRPSAKMSPNPNAAGSSIKKRRIRSRTRSVKRRWATESVNATGYPRARNGPMLQAHCVSDPTPICPRAGHENSAASRLRNVPKHFRRSSASFPRT
jgi:hypothetical protein